MNADIYPLMCLFFLIVFTVGVAAGSRNRRLDDRMTIEVLEEDKAVAVRLLKEQGIDLYDSLETHYQTKWQSEATQ